MISFTSLLERSRTKLSQKSLVDLYSQSVLTEILDIVVETRGESEETSPAAVCRGELTGAEERVAEPLSSARHHQHAQDESQQSEARYGKALASITRMEIGFLERIFVT